MDIGTLLIGFVMLLFVLIGGDIIKDALIGKYNSMMDDKWADSFMEAAKEHSKRAFAEEHNSIERKYHFSMRDKYIEAAVDSKRTRRR